MTVTTLRTSAPHPRDHRARDERTEELFLEASDCPDPRSSHLRNEAVELNLGLAASVARRYLGRGIDLDDLVQVARFGLVKASQRYRPGAGAGFGAFAVPTMSGEVKRYFRDQGSPIRPPRHLQETRALVVSLQQDLEQSLGREPTTEETARACDLTVAEVRDAQDARQRYHCLSLDVPTGDGRSGSVGDVVPDSTDEYAAVDTRDALHRALGTLRDRERLVVRLRFEENLTQAEIGTAVGVSQMQVSRILAGIAKHLRAEMETAEVRQIA